VCWSAEVHVCVCVCVCVCVSMSQDDVPSVDPIDISLNQLDLNEVNIITF